MVTHGTSQKAHSNGIDTYCKPLVNSDTLFVIGYFLTN